ncbi:MAG: hypothetical protein U0744_06630 [Gemmataceae bacterium]
MAVLATMLFAGIALSAEWEPMVADLLKAEKPGYGGLTGLHVDRESGDVFVWLSDKGLYRSTDQAKTFAPLGKAVKGRTEWPGAMVVQGAGPMAHWTVALVYGDPILGSKDGGKTFNRMAKNSTHVDWVAVDPERKFVLTLKHEANDLLLASNDGGQNFREVGKGYGPACIFDEQTAVVVRITPGEPKKPAKRSLVRTTDGGKTFEHTADFATKAVPTWFAGKPYWLVEGAIITSADQGKTWAKHTEVKNGQFGPIFGKDEKHMFVLTPAGIISTTDGGSQWSQPIAPPRDMKGLGQLSWIGYDAKNNILYLMKMTSDLYRMKL